MNRHRSSRRRLEKHPEYPRRCCSVTGLVDGASVCAPAPTPRLGRASAVAVLPWRPQGAASSS
ncbi:hypothetical protein T492DRAFT_973504 [Pavlovales sp. CCMP2436]|nr:hypothetical protein T492DRAFT_973504 [Pavlovales sp. CCMP2436]